MEITKVTAFKVDNGKVKANGVVTLNESVELKYALMQGPKDLFISWSGGKAYTKKDGTKGWDSPIFVKDEALNQKITKEVIAKYKAVTGGSAGSGKPSTTTGSESSFSDDIPF